MRKTNTRFLRPTSRRRLAAVRGTALFKVALVAAMVVSGAFPAHAIKDILVPSGAVWRFLDDGSDAGTAWIPNAFDDSTWASGPAQLGYAGRMGQATLVSYGPDINDKYETTYFRHTFNVANAALYSNLTLRLLRDDAAVVYLNGTEVHRFNLPAGPVGFQDVSTYIVGGDEEFKFYDIDISPAVLVSGSNTLAVEIHRHVAANRIGFNLELVAGDALRVPVVTRGPYLQQASPGDVSVRWRTDIPTSSAVRYGSSPATLSNIQSTVPNVFEHEVALAGLIPGSRVFYSVGTTGAELVGGDANHFIDVPPLVGTTDPVKIWVTGDSGTANFRARAVRDAYLNEGGALNTDLFLMLGDSAYHDGTDSQFQVALFDMYSSILRNTPTWATIGNHEAHTAVSATQTGAHFENFTLPKMGEAGGIASGTEAYYSFDYANIHFICMDSYGTNRSAGGAMMTWLAADLADTQQDWIIAFWHHPPYSRGSHDSDFDGLATDMRTNAMPLLEAAGADLILAGHSHSYERSMLIDGHYGTSGTLLPEMVLNSGDGDPLGDGAYVKSSAIKAPHSGAVYAVAGSSGQTQSAPLGHPVMVTSLLELGSIVIDVAGSQMQVRFLDDAGVTRDQFTIQKEVLAPVPTLDPLTIALVVMLLGACGAVMRQQRAA